MKLCPQCRNSYPDDYQSCPRDLTPLTDTASEIAPGTLLRGKYEVLSQIGAGGMATVYKVRHRAFQEIAAVKIVHTHFMHDPTFVKRFRNEAVVARQLKHPNAVRIDDFDSTDDGRPFIVMEFVDGHSLYELRKSTPGPLTIDLCLNIVSQVAEALGAAHALGIVHRDIKPANIILLRGPGDQPHVKVLDFGIAKVGAADTFAGMTSVLTQPSLVIGTPEYMSPEQAGGRLETAIDGRSDLYSLGLVLYEMLTGAHPFQADTPIGMLLQQLNTHPAAPDSVHAVSPAISALVLKSLQKDPADRFQSAAELLTALRNPESWFAAQSPTQISTQATPEPTRPTLQSAIPNPPEPPAPIFETKPAAATVETPGRSRLPIALALAAIVLIAAGVWAYLAFRTPPKPALIATTIDNNAPARTGQTTPERQPSLPSTPPPAIPTQTIPQPKSLTTATTPPPQAQKTSVSATASAPAGAEEKPTPPPPLEPPQPPAPAKPTPAALEVQAHQFILAKQYSDALPFARSACDASSTSGCYDLAWLYEKGNAVPRDLARAVELYTKSCDGGYASACRNLGYLYEHDPGIPTDFGRAANLYRRACNAGEPRGCANLGNLYQAGRGVTQDPALAATLYRKGCDGGANFGCGNLGLSYRNGSGVPRDYVQAIALFRKACDDQDYPACANLALAYHNGTGLPQDHAQAVPLDRKACDGGDARGCADLALAYLRGDGVAENRPQALDLYRKACTAGNAPACDSAQKLTH